MSRLVVILGLDMGRPACHWDVRFVEKRLMHLTLVNLLFAVLTFGLANYHPRMRVGNVFGHVCLSVCLSVQAITFELLDIKTSFLVCRYILIISRSSLSIKVIGSRSRSYEKK